MKHKGPRESLKLGELHWCMLIFCSRKSEMKTTCKRKESQPKAKRRFNDAFKRTWMWTWTLNCQDGSVGKDTFYWTWQPEFDLETHMVERENWFLQVVLWLPVSVSWYTHVFPFTYKKINVIKINVCRWIFSQKEVCKENHLFWLWVKEKNSTQVFQ